VIWLGNGAKLADAGEVALQLAEQLECPVITTFNGIGAVRTTHPNVMGPLSRMGVGIALATLEGSDTLLAVGNSLNAISTGRWTIPLPETIIQIDIEPRNIGRYYFERTHRLTGDAEGVLGQLVTAVSAHETKLAASSRRARLEALKEAKSAWLSNTRAVASSNTELLTPDQLVFSLRDACPDETILVVDAGNPGVWTHLWEIRAPRTYIKPVGYANMGFALPAAIAAKLARPDAPVVALLGDGSLGMSMGELETVARERVDVCIVVMNDLGYGNIRQEQDVKVEGRRIGVDFDDVDYAGIARACGLAGETVRSLPELEAAVARSLQSGSATLIDVRIDPDLSVWTYPPFKDGQMED
jgi:acetolactate synthase I/II/III large subunit